MSASREKKLRQDQTASGYVDPKAEKELEEKKAEKRSNVLYSVIAVLFVLVVAASFLWRSNVISRNATALTIDGRKVQCRRGEFLLSECLPRLPAEQFLLHQLSGSGHQRLPEEPDSERHRRFHDGRRGRFLLA